MTFFLLWNTQKKCFDVLILFIFFILVCHLLRYLLLCSTEDKNRTGLEQDEGK